VVDTVDEVAEVAGAGAAIGNSRPRSAGKKIQAAEIEVTMTLDKARAAHEESETAAHPHQSPGAEKRCRPPVEELKGRGRLVPAQATGIEYPVEFGIKTPPAAPHYGRVSQPTQWAKCVVRPDQKRAFPDGHYFLHTDEGRVHQLKVIGGVWHCLALAV